MNGTDLPNSLPRFVRQLLSQLALALNCLAGREILQLEDLPDLDLGSSIEGGPLEPLDRLIHGLHLPQPESGNQLLGLGERAIGADSLSIPELHALALRARLQPFGGQQDAGLL